MSKRGGNHPISGPSNGQGGHYDDRARALMSKQALAREAARTRRRAGRKTKLGQAPLEQRAQEPVVPSSTVLAAAHDREFARMNERKPPRRGPSVERRANEAEQPSYLLDSARGLLRRVARVALAPLALARAVVHRLRDRD